MPERPQSWDGKDWWGHPDSLSHPHYDGGINEEVVAAFRKDNLDPNTDVILLTGRRGVIAHKVREVMRSQGLYGRRVIPDSNKTAVEKYQSAIQKGMDMIHPDEHGGHEEYYSGDHSTEEDYPKGPKGKPDGNTGVFKDYMVRRKVGPNTEYVEFWDDREDHVALWCKLGVDLLKKYGETAGGRLKSVIFHRVFAPQYQGGKATIRHIPIQIGMVY